MKNVILFLLLTTGFSAMLHGQTLCDETCYPDQSCSPSVEDGGYCPSPVPSAIVGEYYHLDLTAIAPKSGEYDGNRIEVNYIEVLAIEGLPEGLTWCKSATKFVWKKPECIQITGIPAQIGAYPLVIKVRAAVLGGMVKVNREDKSLTMHVVKSQFPEVDFAADTTKAKINTEIHFATVHDASVQAWNWTFEGGNPSTSTIPNPSVSWERAGFYSVSLEETNTIGSKQITKYNYIQIFDTAENVTPLAMINTDKKSGVIGEEFVFSDDCSQKFTEWITPEDNNIYQIFCPDSAQMSVRDYLWSFEGGTPRYSTDPNPVVHWEKAGKYSVSLLVNNESGMDEFVLRKYITIYNITGLRVYPNPTANVLIVEDMYIKHIDVYNLYGNLLLSQDCHSTHHVMNVGHLAAGFYIVKVTYTNGDQESRKFIVEY